jgi:cytochrome c553
MIALAQAATEADIDAAAAYFSALKPKRVTTVIETDVAPRTFVFGWHLADSKTGEKEPIAGRIIEVPDDLERFALRDARARFTAYVPVGSVKKGEILVNTGGGKTLQCATCHGPDLKGLGDVPRIAGMSPSYVVRQLYDIQNGARAGPGAQPMNDTVAGLTLDDMVSIAAYLASRDP